MSATMNNTPKGIILSKPWEHGITIGIYGYIPIASLEYDENTDKIVLLLNDDAITNSDITILHTDKKWNIKTP